MPTNNNNQSSQSYRFDFAYLKTSTDEQNLAVLTAVDVQSQLCMALAVPDKAIQHDYMINSLRSFILLNVDVQMASFNVTMNLH